MGALHHMFRSFDEIARHGGRVHLGRVVASRDGGATVDVEIRQTWPPAPPPPRRRWWQRRRPAPAPGPDVRTFALTPPVAWTDPHRSPVELGIAGGLRRLEADRDALIVEDMFVLGLDASERNLETVRIAFEADARAAYLAGPVRALTADLSDPSRRDLALDALCARDAIDGALLLDAHEPGALRGLLERVLARAPRERLIAQMADWIDAHPAPGRGERLVTVLDHVRGWPELAGVARLASALDPAHPPERSAIYPIERLLCDRWKAGAPLVDGWERAILRVLETCDLAEHALPALEGVAAAVPAEALRALADGPRRKLLGAARVRWLRTLANRAPR